MNVRRRILALAADAATGRLSPAGSTELGNLLLAHGPGQVPGLEARIVSQRAEIRRLSSRVDELEAALARGRAA
jgi:hypothetical protein